MPTTTDTRASSCKVTEVLSEAISATLPLDEDSVWGEMYPEKVDRLGYPLAELQKVEWEVYKGVYGANTLLKEVEATEQDCGECGGEGWYDEKGDVICNCCGLLLNSTPMMIPEDNFNSRTGGPTAGSAHNVFFNDGTGSPAMNQNTTNAGDEPDVQ